MTESAGPHEARARPCGGDGLPFGNGDVIVVLVVYHQSGYPQRRDQAVHAHLPPHRAAEIQLDPPRQRGLRARRIAETAGPEPQAVGAARRGRRPETTIAARATPAASCDDFAVSLWCWRACRFSCDGASVPSWRTAILPSCAAEADDSSGYDGMMAAGLPGAVMNPYVNFIGHRCGVPPLRRAVIRSRPEDFIVREILGFGLDGEGEHLWLRVRKRGYTTDFVAGVLAGIAGIRRGEVGYAGLKDKFAVTEQWFSLQLPKADPDWSALPQGIEVLESTRHHRKLRTGALKGNEFELVARDCEGESAAFDRRIDTLAKEGFPNYFGEQRFGYGGGNLDHAEAMFTRRERVKDRYRRGIYISAARSAIFNAVLDARVVDGSWCHVIPGDVMQLDGSNSWFVIDQPDEDIVRRCREGDIHPTGPLWGDGDPPTRHGALEREQEIANRFEVLRKGLADTRMDHDRRALRVMPQGLSAEWRDDATVQLRFVLPAGSYATVLLRELAEYGEGEG